jgi:hypothetical protein
MQPETKFKIKVMADLKKLPHILFVKTQQVAIRGTPDILACIKGRFVALELKRSQEERADPLQAHNLDMIEFAGGLAYVVNPTNWPAVYEAMTSLAYHGHLVQ